MTFICYVDVLWLVNFWVSLLLVLLTRMVIRAERLGRCFAAAACSSCLSTVLFLCYLGTGKPLILTVGSMATGLLTAVLAFGRRRLLWHMLLFGMEGAVLHRLLSVLILLFSGKVLDGAIFVAALAATAAGCLLLEQKSRIQWREEHCKAKVVLEYQNRKMLATALVDTGNRLVDPFFQRPVILVERELLQDALLLCRTQQPERVQYIPYHSVGRKNGVLEGMMLDSVKIRWENRTWLFSDVIAAAAEERMSREKEYQVIFHCGLFHEA